MLTRFGARDYDPLTGHWTMWDPIGFEGGSWNLRSYALQDPVNVFDPDGLQNLSENGITRVILSPPVVKYTETIGKIVGGAGPAESIFGFKGGPPDLSNTGYGFWTRAAILLGWVLKKAGFSKVHMLRSIRCLVSRTRAAIAFGSGFAHYQEGDFERAAQLFQSAREHARPLEDKDSTRLFVQSSAYLAQSLVKLRLHAKAIPLFREVHAAYADWSKSFSTSQRAQFAEFLMAFSEALVATGDLAQANRLRDEAQDRS